MAQTMESLNQLASRIYNHFGKPATPDDINNLSGIISENLNPKVSFLDKLEHIDNVTKSVCDEFGLTVNDLQSRDRSEDYVEARKKIILGCISKYDYNHRVLGKAIGRKRSTVSHWIKKIKEQYGIHTEG